MRCLAISMSVCTAVLLGAGPGFAAEAKPAKKAEAKPPKAAKGGKAAPKPAARPQCNLKQAATGPVQGQLLGAPAENMVATLHGAVVGEKDKPQVFRLTICQRREGGSCGPSGPTVFFDLPSRAAGVYEADKIAGALSLDDDPVPRFEQKNPPGRIELVTTDTGELAAKVIACFDDEQASWIRGELPVALVK
jgi:hypothetical protein